MEIEGRRALVTGAARRVGRAIALELARRGARVAVHYHTSGDAAREVAAACPGSVLLRADLARPAGLVEEAAAALGGLDILVNNAAVYRKTPLESVGEAEFDEAVGVNLRAPFFLARDAGLRMRESGGGLIVNLTDASLRRPYPAYLPYFAAKAGLEALTRGLARALAPSVRVNAIAPGPVLLPEGVDPGYAARVERAVPLGRLGGATPVVEALLFLIGNDFVTGASIRVDGGRSLG